MEIIGIQTDIAWEERDTNFARVREMLAAARVAPGSLLVLPEMFALGFTMEPTKVDRRRETELFLQDLARQHQCHIIGGIVSQTGKVASNEAVVVTPAGTQLGKYRKMHPFSMAGEGEVYTAGNQVKVFDCGGMRVAPSICYDLRFPELYREAASLGAELYVVIANWPVARIDHWQTLLKARAIENQAYVVGINRVGEDPQHTYNGKSMIIDPRGQTLAEGGSAPMLLRARAEARAVSDWRLAFPALADRRNDWAQGNNTETGLGGGAGPDDEWEREQPTRRGSP